MDKASNAFGKASADMEKAVKEMEKAVDEMGKAVGGSVKIHEKIMTRTFKFASTVASEKKVEVDTVSYRFRALTFGRRLSLAWLFIRTSLTVLFKGETYLRVAAPKESAKN